MCKPATTSPDIPAAAGETSLARTSPCSKTELSKAASGEAKSVSETLTTKRSGSQQSVVREHLPLPAEGFCEEAKENVEERPRQRETGSPSTDANSFYQGTPSVIMNSEAYYEGSEIKVHPDDKSAVSSF